MPNAAPDRYNGVVLDAADRVTGFVPKGRAAGTWSGNMEVYDARSQEKIGDNLVTIDHKPTALTRATQTIARRQGPQAARAVPAVVRAARRTAARQGAPPNCTFVEGDVTALPFPYGAFDLSGCLRVLHHVRRPELVVASRMLFISCCMNSASNCLPLPLPPRLTTSASTHSEKPMMQAPIAARTRSGCQPREASMWSRRRVMPISPSA